MFGYNSYHRNQPHTSENLRARRHRLNKPGSQGGSLTFCQDRPAPVPRTGRLAGADTPCLMLLSNEVARCLDKIQGKIILPPGWSTFTLSDILIDIRKVDQSSVAVQACLAGQSLETLTFFVCYRCLSFFCVNISASAKQNRTVKFHLGERNPFESGATSLGEQN